MPFKSYDEETFMEHNKPKLYKKWIKKYGHYTGTVKNVPEKKKTLKKKKKNETDKKAR